MTGQQQGTWMAMAPTDNASSGTDGPRSIPPVDCTSNTVPEFCVLLLEALRSLLDPSFEVVGRLDRCRAGTRRLAQDLGSCDRTASLAPGALGATR